MPQKAEIDGAEDIVWTRTVRIVSPPGGGVLRQPFNQSIFHRI